MNMGGLIDLFPDIPHEQGEVVKLSTDSSTNHP